MSKAKKCPFCGGKLDDGYLVLSRGANLTWDTKKHRLITWTSDSLFSAPFVPVNIPTLRCEHCRIMIIDYGMTVKDEES
jgi:hypothetical protein